MARRPDFTPKTRAQIAYYMQLKRRFRQQQQPAPSDPFASLMSTLLSGASQLIAHPLKYGSMFQDRAGTTPVTEPGQLVGRVLDVGGGDFHATAVSDAARGIYRDVGGLRYIEYNGVNTAYQTPVLPAPGVDKAQVFAGVRKLSDAAVGAVTEMSPSLSGNAGSLILFTPKSAGDATYGFHSRGSFASSNFATSASYAAPTSNVITAQAEIATDTQNLRIDGLIDGSSSADQGTGNFNPSGTYPLYYGARAGTSLFFNGHHYGTLGPIARFGTNATAEQIAAAESYYTKEAGL